MKKYELTTDTKYLANKRYYSYNSGTKVYTLLVAPTDYVVGANVVGSVYEVTNVVVSVCGAKFNMSDNDYEKNRVIVDDEDLPFPSTLPVSLNDVDLDPFTNTDGYTIRNRVREGVVSLEFFYNVLNGHELNQLLNLTKKVWMNVNWFHEKEDKRVTQKFYRSTLDYDKYYVCDNLDDCRYTNVAFTFVEQ